MLSRGDILRNQVFFLDFSWSLAAVAVYCCFFYFLMEQPPHTYLSIMCLLFLLQMQEFWSTGVLTAKTRCWAQGMDGWRPLQAIPQLKWCLLATGQAVMNESDLATMILNMLITMCSYYPSRWVEQKIPPFLETSFLWYHITIRP